MTSSLAYRHTITGELVARSPVHIGDHADGIDVDLRQVVDGQGRAVLPGTAITGALRATLARENPAWDGDEWWGTATADTGLASSVSIDDAPSKGAARLEVRDGVSIDRVTGAAAFGHLYSRAVVTFGTAFTFTLAMDVATTTNDEAATEFLTALVGLLCGSGIRVGAVTSSGLGHVVLRGASWHKANLTSVGGLKEALLGKNRGERGTIPTVRPDEVRPGQLRIEIPWRPVGPIMTKVAAEGHHASGFPQTRLDAETSSVTLVIPGSSLKGVLRAHSERIIRTAVAGPDTLPERFLCQLEAADALPGVSELFGTAGNADRGESGSRGALTVPDTTSAVGIPADKWQLVRHGRAGHDGRSLRHYMQDLDALNTAVAERGIWFDLATRNAVDRWSGGVASGALYSTVEPYADADAWNPMVLELDVARLLRRQSSTGLDPSATVALIVLLLRDLSDGWIPLGFGTTRGLGSITAPVAGIKFTAAKDVAAANEVIAQIHGRKLKSVLASEKVVKALDTAWSAVLPPETVENPA